MNSLTFVAIFATLAATYAAPSATIVQGPSARATIVGSDGSVISSAAPGGQIISEEHPGVIAHTSPAHLAPAVVSTYAAPAYPYHGAPLADVHSAYAYHGTPVVGAHSAYFYHGSPVIESHPIYSYQGSPVVEAHSAYSYGTPLVSAYAAPVQSTFDTVVAGPSGTIATSKTVGAPAVVAAHGVHGYYH